MVVHFVSFLFLFEVQGQQEKTKSFFGTKLEMWPDLFFSFRNVTNANF